MSDSDEELQLHYTPGTGTNELFYPDGGGPSGEGKGNGGGDAQSPGKHCKLNSNRKSMRILLERVYKLFMFNMSKFQDYLIKSIQKGLT